MAEIDRADASIEAAPTSSDSERGEGKISRSDRGAGAPHHRPPGRIFQFLHDVRAEMKRVSWPNAATVKNTTIITLVAVIFFAIYLFVVDTGMTYLVKGIDWVIARLANLLGIG